MESILERTEQPVGKRLKILWDRLFTDINIDKGDPDDRQSLIHLLWYADELQGIILRLCTPIINQPWKTSDLGSNEINQIVK